MLVEQIIKDTLELQGFRIVSVKKTIIGLTVQLDADRRFKPRCGVCGNKAAYRDTRKVRCFRHVPLWGIPVTLRYAPRPAATARSAARGSSVPRAAGFIGKRFPGRPGNIT